MSWKRLSENLYVWSDTCNVYCVKDGEHGLLIDAGSGAVADHIGEIGVRQIDWVLHTHHHRDQCWGTGKLREAGAKVAVPEHERYLFEDVELFWRHKRLYSNYNDRNTFFSVGKDMPVDESLLDYETFTWRGLELEILPAKGHTHGSSMFVGEIDGREVAFTGDLIGAGGVLYQYHAMEYGYGDQAGALFTLQSCQALRKRAPQLALPSHGEVITDPVGDCLRLEERLMNLARLGGAMRIFGSIGDHGLDFLPDPRFIQLSRHLLWSGPQACSNFYVVLSESGKAFFLDYGHSYYAHMSTGSDREDSDTMRFVVHHLDELRESYGVNKIDVVMNSHIHDDHTVGVPYLVRHEGTQVWALEEVAQVLEDPAAWCSTPCTLKKPIPVSRKFKDGDRFQWEEYEFEIYHAPGQTEFHMLLASVVDGQKIMFTGDNVFKAEAPGVTGGLTDQVYQTTVLRNSFQLWMHRKCADLMESIAPDVVCPGHRDVMPWDARKTFEYRDFIARKERVLRALVDEPADHYVDLWWARLLPYDGYAAPGETIDYRLLLRNNLGRDAVFEARLSPPEGWQSSGEFTEIRIADEARGELLLTATAPDEPRVRQLLTVEVRIDGETQGPVTEALVTVSAGG